MMLDPARIYATAIYLASIIIALFCALYVHNKLLTLLAIILEFGALIWYVNLTLCMMHLVCVIRLINLIVVVTQYGAETVPFNLG